ncbi:uncharacterized protein LOC107046780 isoform X2 [Diachasma alloeum]|uniref:uncharacterized protein LOC107046780 isoform X2 n=1 Tax=Diachasma alloeum TaxID=454923 RepID=UPI0007381285|nr:uncharacterized protein LOC107046780 isoform X2 [Diachasma alloeum]
MRAEDPDGVSDLEHTTKISISDPMTGKEYTVLLSNEDAGRAMQDNQFASALLASCIQQEEFDKENNPDGFGAPKYSSSNDLDEWSVQKPHPYLEVLGKSMESELNFEAHLSDDDDDEEVVVEKHSTEKPTGNKDISATGKYKWSKAATKLFLDLYTEEIQKLSSKLTKTTKVQNKLWEAISSEHARFIGEDTIYGPTIYCFISG